MRCSCIFIIKSYVPIGCADKLPHYVAGGIFALIAVTAPDYSRSGCDLRRSHRRAAPKRVPVIRQRTVNIHTGSCHLIFTVLTDNIIPVGKACFSAVKIGSHNTNNIIIPGRIYIFTRTLGVISRRQTIITCRRNKHSRCKSVRKRRLNKARLARAAERHIDNIRAVVGCVLDRLCNIA